MLTYPVQEVLLNTEIGFASSQAKEPRAKSETEDPARELEIAVPRSSARIREQFMLHLLLYRRLKPCRSGSMLGG